MVLLFSFDAHALQNHISFLLIFTRRFMDKRRLLYDQNSSNWQVSRKDLSIRIFVK